MDVLLENGDIVCGRDGTPVMIGGARELAQRRDTHAEQVCHIRHQFLLKRLIGRIRQRSDARLQGLVILWSHRLFLSFGAVRS